MDSQCLHLNSLGFTVGFVVIVTLDLWLLLHLLRPIIPPPLLSEWQRRTLRRDDGGRSIPVLGDELPIEGGVVEAAKEPGVPRLLHEGGDQGGQGPVLHIEDPEPPEAVGLKSSFSSTFF